MMAQAREQQGQQTAAQEIYAQVYADRAGHYADRALYNAALLAYKAEDLEAAGQLVASLEQDHPRSGLLTEARYVLGLVRFAQGQYVAAAAAFRRAEPSDASHPLAPAIFYRTGEALRQAGQFKEANRFFVRVKESWPDSELADDSVCGYMQSALDSGDHALVGSAPSAAISA